MTEMPSGGEGLEPEARDVYIELVRRFNERMRRPEARQLLEASTETGVPPIELPDAASPDAVLLANTLSSWNLVFANALLETVAEYLAERGVA